MLCCNKLVKLKLVKLKEVMKRRVPWNKCLTISGVYINQQKCILKSENGAIFFRFIKNKSCRD